MVAWSDILTLILVIINLVEVFLVIHNNKK
jgi:hypothetical protein